MYHQASCTSRTPTSSSSALFERPRLYDIGEGQGEGAASCLPAPTPPPPIGLPVQEKSSSEATGLTNDDHVYYTSRNRGMMDGVFHFISETREGFRCRATAQALGDWDHTLETRHTDLQCPIVEAFVPGRASSNRASTRPAAALGENRRFGGDDGCWARRLPGVSVGAPPLLQIRERGPCAASCCA